MATDGCALNQITRAAGLAGILLALACTTSTETHEPRPFPTPFEVIAHRGASAYAPENTIPAFQKAYALGVVDVELDIQLSQDGEVILFHDSSLREKTGEIGAVRDHLASDLLEMDIGRWFDRTHPEVEQKWSGTTLCTLGEVFERFGDRFHYHIELKSDDVELTARALDQIRAHGLESRVRFTSFRFEQAERARRLAPEIPTGLLVRDAARLRREAPAPDGVTTLSLQQAEIDRARMAGIDQVGFPAEDLTPELIRYAQGRGLEIRAWRIRSDADMHRAIDLGAMGMTTNWPDRVVRELLRHKRRRTTR